MTKLNIFHEKKTILKFHKWTFFWNCLFTFNKRMKPLSQFK